jgi:predicted RNA-binding Zn-ribbon protein involved in translation (DUF1610 family)
MSALPPKADITEPPSNVCFVPIADMAEQTVRKIFGTKKRVPSRTATVSRCPQCGAIMRLKIIEPDLKNPSKARHVFECEECSLPRTYFIEAA